MSRIISNSQLTCRESISPLSVCGQRSQSSYTIVRDLRVQSVRLITIKTSLSGRTFAPTLSLMEEDMYSTLKTMPRHLEAMSRVPQLIRTQLLVLNHQSSIWTTKRMPMTMNRTPSLILTTMKAVKSWLGRKQQALRSKSWIGNNKNQWLTNQT